MHIQLKCPKRQFVLPNIISWFAFLIKMDCLTHEPVTVCHQEIIVGDLIAPLSGSHSVELQSIHYKILLLTMFTGNTER
jgi:hypothetical protein